jgi:hypothetical protein
MERSALSLAAIVLLAAVAGPAFAAPFDNQPKILLHVADPTAKNACALGRLADCRTARTHGDLYANTQFGYWVFLLAARGHVDSVGALECGITYQGGAPGAANDGIGLDVFGWTLCGTTESPDAGPVAWPGAGSGNRIAWSTPAVCATTEVGVSGYFYVAAYAPDTLRVIARPATGLARIQSCDGASRTLAADELGWAAFSAGQSLSGCNPCVQPCDGSPIAVSRATWSRVKTLRDR